MEEQSLHLNDESQSEPPYEELPSFHHPLILCWSNSHPKKNYPGFTSPFCHCPISLLAIVAKCLSSSSSTLSTSYSNPLQSGFSPQPLHWNLFWGHQWPLLPSHLFDILLSPPYLTQVNIHSWRDTPIFGLKALKWQHILLIFLYFSDSCLKWLGFPEFYLFSCYIPSLGDLIQSHAFKHHPHPNFSISNQSPSTSSLWPLYVGIS